MGDSVPYFHNSVTIALPSWGGNLPWDDNLSFWGGDLPSCSGTHLSSVFSFSPYCIAKDLEFGLHIGKQLESHSRKKLGTEVRLRPAQYAMVVVGIAA